MRPLRTLALTFALIAAAGLLFSTVGFSAAEIDRSIDIDIVDDQSAAIGYEAHDPNPGNKTEEEALLLTVTNGLNSNVNVTVDVSDGGPVVNNSNHNHDQLEPGEKLKVEQEVRCEGEDRNEPYHITVNIAASGDDVDVDFQETRQTITCTS